VALWGSFLAVALCAIAKGATVFLANESMHLTAYRLWQMARVHCSTLSQSAVHRQLELPSIEALLAAMDLQVVSKRIPRKRTPLHGE
jgi:hypothetical protein